MYPTSKLLLIFCVGIYGKNINQPDSSEGDPLNLTPLVEKGEVAKARKLSAVDPTIFAGVQSYAAFFNVNKTNKWNLFFWFFPAEGKPLDTTPLIIWLQGGPGSSSLFGLFQEIGPIEIVNNKVQKKPITWGSDYSLLFIDNPAGAGFSYSESDQYAQNEDDVGSALLSFIQQFLQVYPELRKAPLFITGESYAGKYIPAFGHYIHHNKNDSMPINLKGLAIGDGWTDPPTLLHYSEFLTQIGFADPDDVQEFKNAEVTAREYWAKGDIENYKKKTAEAFYGELNLIPNNMQYNYLEDFFPESTDDYTLFINREDVRAALHVGNVPYDDFNGNARNALLPEMFSTVKPWLEDLLEHYPVMGYRYIKEGGNFLEVMVRGAGHMVPSDQPTAAKYIIDIFINKYKL